MPSVVDKMVLHFWNARMPVDGGKKKKLPCCTRLVVRRLLPEAAPAYTQQNISVEGVVPVLHLNYKKVVCVG